MDTTNGIGRGLSAIDPGRIRLRLALAIAAGILLSAIGAWAIVHFLHADSALLTVGVFLGLQMGLTPHDATARGRFTTTALLILPTASSATIAAFLAQWRPLEIAVLICIAGAGTFARRYGPRATALGFAAFFGYFFALLLELTPAQLPSFLLVAASSVGALTLMRATLLVERPRQQIELLLRELRSASMAAIVAAWHPETHHPRVLRNRLARVDSAARAITAWQQEFITSRHLDIDETTLASLVLDARISIEQACLELERDAGADANPAVLTDPQVNAAIRDLIVVLDNHAKHSAIEAAAQRATITLTGLAPTSSLRAPRGRIARSSLAHKALRDVALARVAKPLAAASVTSAAPSAPSGNAAGTDAGTAAAPALNAASSATQSSPTRWWDWKHWQLTTRLAIQIMVAVALATVAGEAISASRWYWAVLTAFIVFVGATTRGTILTRAYNRITGTVAGLAVGVGFVLLAHEQKPILVAICVVAAFGMMYFGPVRYLYSAFFMSIMLVSTYGLLGDLDTQILELRIGETLAGALIGVLCAYLIFSSSSRPTLLSKVDSYFAAFDQLLVTARDALTAPSRDGEVLASVGCLGGALHDIDTFTASMSVAFLGPKHTQRAPIVRLLTLGTRASESFAQSAIAVTTEAPVHLLVGDAASALEEALGHLRDTAATARASFDSNVDKPASDGSVILELLPRIPFDALSPQASAIVDLARVNWVMARIAQTNREG